MNDQIQILHKHAQINNGLVIKIKKHKTQDRQQLN